MKKNVMRLGLWSALLTMTARWPWPPCPTRTRLRRHEARRLRRKNKQYTSVEQEGKTPGPWQLGSWGEGAESEAACGR
jgi:hypothetical protein